MYSVLHCVLTYLLSKYVTFSNPLIVAKQPQSVLRSLSKWIALLSQLNKQQ